MTAAERNYSATDKECLAVIFAVQKYRHYLLANHFFLVVDHQALLYLVSKASLTGRITRWILLLQEFSFTIIHKLGKLHFRPDLLSRLPGTGPPGALEDFPDA